MERKVTHEQLQELGQEIQKLVEAKLQRAFEGPGDLRAVGAAAVMGLIDYAADGNARYLARSEEILKLVNDGLEGK
jgi:hypothetical protein